MSGIFVRSDFHDNTAFKYFLNNSNCSVLSTYSNNAIVFKLELIPKPDLKYPYGTLKLNKEGVIEVVNVTIIVLKFLIINKTKSNLYHDGKRHNYYPELTDLEEDSDVGYENGIKEIGRLDFLDEIKNKR